MKQPETSLEIWLARDGWNEIDPGLRLQRAKGRAWLLAALGVAAGVAPMILADSDAWKLYVVSLICFGFSGSLLYALNQGSKFFPLTNELMAFENLWTSEGKNLLEQKLKEIVGPNNTRDRRPGDYPPAHKLSIQKSAKAVFNDKELRLLEPLADLVIKKMDQMDRGENEPIIFVVNLQESMRIAFSLIAKLQVNEDQFQQVEAEFLRMEEIINGFPTVMSLQDVEQSDRDRNSYQAWRAFTRQHQAG